MDDKYTPLIGTDKFERNSTLSICNLCCFQNPKKEKQAPPQRPALPKFTTVTSVTRTWTSPPLRSSNINDTTCILQRNWSGDSKGLLQSMNSNICSAVPHPFCTWEPWLKCYYFPLVVFWYICTCLLHISPPMEVFYVIMERLERNLKEVLHYDVHKWEKTPM